MICARRGLTVAGDIWPRDRRRFYVERLWEIAGELRSAGYSLPEIGMAMHRHHTTIMDGLRGGNRRMPPMRIPAVAAVFCSCHLQRQRVA